MEIYQESLSIYSQTQQLTLLFNNTSHAGVMADPHWHNAWEILFIRRGWGDQQINAERLSFHPNDIVVIRPGDVHRTDALSDKGCDIDVLHFTESMLPDGSSVRIQLSSGVFHPEPAHIGQLFDMMRQYTPYQHPGRDMAMGGLVQALIGLVQMGTPPDFRRYSPFIEAVCAWAKHTKDLQLSTAAARFGYSPEHLSRTFHSETGISYRLYCDRLRMRRAASLLNGPSSMSEIAEQLGYSDASSFIRAFRQMYGITPGVYRRLCKPVNQ